MAKAGCNHTQAYIVARALRRRRELSAFTAVYEGIDCPVDGTKHRITRLAAIIFTLRHELSWVIDQSKEPGKLALYTLVGEGLLPVETKGAKSE